MKDKKISIIIPNHNGAKYLIDCLESVLAQKHSNFEVIIIDDGSSDGSRQIIEDYCTKDHRFKAIFQSQMNASIARNRGIEEAESDYLYFLDSDDLLLPNGLTILLNRAEASQADLVIGYLEIFTSKDHFIRKDFDQAEDIDDPMALTYYTYNPSNKLYKASVIKEHKVNWGNVRIAQDMNFFLKYLLAAKKVALVDKVIFRYRINDTNMSHQYDFRILDVTNAVKDIQAYYFSKEAEDKFHTYISGPAFQAYYAQMDKQRFFQDRSSRRLVVNHLNHHMKLLQGPLRKVGRKKLLEYRLNMMIQPLYVSGLAFKLTERIQ